MKKDKDFTRVILTKLMRKYYTRKLKYGEQEVNRRIMLKISEVYRDYEKNNCNMLLKTQVNEAVGNLADKQYISVDYLQYSKDIIKIYLNQEMVQGVESYVRNCYGITARDYLVAEAGRLITKYENRGTITAFYCQKLKNEILTTMLEIDLVKEQEILLMLDFLQSNYQQLYVREASMKVYGTSKHFEQKRYESVCNILREATKQLIKENEQNDEILQQFYVTNTEQDISLKGAWIIEFPGYTLEAEHFTGGISFSSKEFGKIRRISVNTKNVMTIENKTAFYRFDKQEYAVMYLGGYANRYQLQFLKQVYADNSDVSFWHFGDIDAGGFLIHQHLCNATGVVFELFGMGIDELKDPVYQKCLISLSENDIQRLEKLRGIQIYNEVVEEMLSRKIKLEQEIICCMICCNG